MLGQISLIYEEKKIIPEWRANGPKKTNVIVIVRIESPVFFYW